MTRQSLQSWVLFFAMTRVFALEAQFTDKFETNGDSLLSHWQGERAHFSIKNGQLQLQAPSAGTSTLYTPFTPRLDQSWSIFTQLNFEPSDNNRLILYLWSSSEVFESSDALYFVLGENGTNDAIQLWSRTDGVEQLLAKGANGAIAAANVPLRISVYIVDGLLTLETDYMGGSCWQVEYDLLLEQWPYSSGYFGWTAQYTSTRTDKFLWDDVQFGAYSPDISGPRVQMLDVETDQLKVLFDEKLDTDLNLIDIQLTPQHNIDYSIRDNLITIDISGGLMESQEYELKLLGIADLRDNQRDTVLRFVTPAVPSLGELIINEVLFNPKTGGSDFVELYNASEKSFQLKGLQIINSRNNQARVLPDILLPAREYVAFTPSRQFLVDNYLRNDPSKIIEWPLPSFNNDEGNVGLVRLKDQLVLDEFDYSEDWHFTFLDDVKGVSLERIDAKAATNQAQNWASASEIAGFATPGVQNSAAFSVNMQNKLELVSKHFTPMSGGQDEFAIIRYSLIRPGYLATIQIFDAEGRWVKELLNNTLLDTQGGITWDGTDEVGVLLPTGIYILHVNLFNTEAVAFSKKLTTVLVNIK